MFLPQKLSSTGERFSLSTGLSDAREDVKKWADERSGGKKIVSVGVWKQLREKFHTLQSELMKWLSIRDQLGGLIDNIVMSINHVHELWSRDNQLEE